MVPSLLMSVHKKLNELGVGGVILGKSLLDGAFSVEDALKLG